MTRREDEEDGSVEAGEIMRIVDEIDEVVVDKVWRIESEASPLEALEERVYYLINEYEALTSI